MIIYQWKYLPDIIKMLSFYTDSSNILSKASQSVNFFISRFYPHTKLLIEKKPEGKIT